MHLRNVEIFCEVATQRSFSKAAVTFNVSQSSASQAVHLLEKRLATVLIDRSKRPLELTPAGQLYFDGCRELLASFRKTEDRVQQLKNRVTGAVRVAAIYSVGLLQMDGYAKRFGELYPDAQLSLTYAHPDDVYEHVIDGSVDLGIVSFPRSRHEVTTVAWQEQEMVLAVRPGHPLAGQSQVAVRELAGEDFVAFDRDLVIRKRVDRWLRSVKVAVHVVHEFDNVENIKRAVEIGSGVALLPLPTVRREVESGSLISISVADVDWRRPLGIIHKRAEDLPVAVSKLIDLLQQDRLTHAVATAGHD